MSRRVLGWLMRLYPLAFRLRFGREMVQIFEVERLEVRNGRPQLLIFLAAVAADIDLPQARYPEHAALADYYDRLLARLRTLPAVRAAEVASSHPLTFYASERFSVSGYTPGEDEVTIARVNYVGPDYLETAGTAVVRGRPLDNRDRRNAVLINETLAQRYFGERDAIGESLRIGVGDGPWRRVAGVVEDVRHYSVGEVDPAIYVPYAGGEWDFTLTLLVRTENDPLFVVPDLRRFAAEIDPQVPIGSVTRLTDLIWKFESAPRLRAAVIGSFGSLALCLSIIGLYGLMTFWVAQRSRELGIRLALGADRIGIAKMVLGRASSLIAAGLCLGCLATIPAGRVLKQYLIGISPGDPGILVIGFSVLAVTGLLASWLPAWRACTTDPCLALRQE